MFINSYSHKYPAFRTQSWITNLPPSHPLSCTQAFWPQPSQLLLTLLLFAHTGLRATVTLKHQWPRAPDAAARRCTLTCRGWSGQRTGCWSPQASWLMSVWAPASSPRRPWPSSGRFWGHDSALPQRPPHCPWLSASRREAGPGPRWSACPTWGCRSAAVPQMGRSCQGGSSRRFLV